MTTHAHDLSCPRPRMTSRDHDFRHASNAGTEADRLLPVSISQTQISSSSAREQGRRFTLRGVPLSTRWSTKPVATKVVRSIGNGAFVQTASLAYHMIPLNNQKRGNLNPNLIISSSNRRMQAFVVKFVELVPRPIRRNQECNVVVHNITQTHMQRFNMCRFSRSRHACPVTTPVTTNFLRLSAIPAWI